MTLESPCVYAGEYVKLDTVVNVFKQGVTAEEIVYRYPCLKLADVYATIGFYLNHQLEVEAYCPVEAIRSSKDTHTPSPAT